MYAMRLNQRTTNTATKLWASTTTTHPTAIGIDRDAKRVEKNLLAIETELESLGKKLGAKTMAAKKLRK